MNWLDIVLIVVLLISTFSGLKTGIIKAVLSLIGLIVGIILAGRYYVPLSEQLTFISQPGIAKGVAFAIILIGVMVVAMVLASLLKQVTSMILLGWVNRIGGAIFGLAMGAFFCGALLAMWLKFIGLEGPISQSVIAPVLLDYFPVVLALLPDEFESVRSFFQSQQPAIH